MPEQIVIIGTAWRLPDRCDSPIKFREPLKIPCDVSKKDPSGGFNVEHLYHPEAAHHDTTKATESSFFEENIAPFDESFFDIQLMERNFVGPQQRSLLQTVYYSLCAESLPMKNLRGLFKADLVGTMSNEWPTMMASDVETLPILTAASLGRRKRSTLKRLSAGLACKIKQLAGKLHGTDFHPYLTFLRALIYRMLPDTSEFLRELSAW